MVAPQVSFIKGGFFMVKKEVIKQVQVLEDRLIALQDSLYSLERVKIMAEMIHISDGLYMLRQSL
jgi:hypothetical protein